MNWEGVAGESREKVESLLNAFGQFLGANHKSGDGHDQRILSEWGTFHKMIQKAPADTQGHNKHVNALRNALLKEDVAKHLGKVGVAEIEKEMSSNIEIDKGALLVISRDLKRNVLRHTKDPLNLLE